MSQESLRPHELAGQLEESAYAIENGRVESKRLGGMVERSQGVWRELGHGKFEEDEFGHATIGIEDWTSDMYSSGGDHVDALNVYYHDPKGNVTELGRVARLDSFSDKATAYVATGEGKKVPLLPTDGRWNAVVGVIERAVNACYEQKRGKK
ncbi:MAG TPA: hypothetical protein VFT53_03480 [Candidatus Saccharimonadales bacterium]|nr:hypothetical protein [Candidatus Saccharimonadales bacterium]